jgi:hypothetical protein
MSASAARDMKTSEEAKDEYEGVYYLPIDDEYELKVALAWFKEKHEARQRATGWPKMSRTIPLPKLTQRAIVVPIIRGEDRTPLVKYFRDINGAPHTEQVSPKSLIGEIRECKPIVVADHWESARDDWDAFGGNLRKPQFLEALGKSSSPIRPCIHIGNEHELKLTFL